MNHDITHQYFRNDMMSKSSVNGASSLMLHSVDRYHVKRSANLMGDLMIYTRQVLPDITHQYFRNDMMSTSSVNWASSLTLHSVDPDHAKRPANLMGDLMIYTRQVLP
jgi:hypothetical protein